MPGDIKAKLEKMADSVRTGGKGSVRRKHKAQHKVSAQDDKKLQASLKKLGVGPIGDVDEVNLFLDGGEVIHFAHPRVQASIQSNTYVVNGSSEIKRVEDLPSAWNQIAGGANLDALKKLMSQMAAAQGGAAPEADGEEKKDEELPAAEDFESEK